MSQILNKIRDVDPNNSDAIKEALGPFFQHLSNHTETDCSLWLRALENVINRFPKYCMSQRFAIETYLGYFLDSNNYYIVIEAAKCAHALQQVRPINEKTATAKSCWRELLKSLWASAHSLISAIFPNAVDIYENRTKKLKDDYITGSPLTIVLSRLMEVKANLQYNNVHNEQSVLCNRLKNVFVFIQAMLVEPYPVGKPIVPQMLLDVIIRALSMSSGTSAAEDDLDEVLIIKTEALRTLDALVLCLGSNLIPFSPLVFRLVMQTLKWSSDNPSEQSSKVRCTAYNSLSGWLRCLRCHRTSTDRARGLEDELTDHILADITPHSHVVELKMSSQPTKHLSKKAKRKLANSMLQNSNMASHMPGEKNKITVSDERTDEVAISALNCAEVFLIVCGIFLKPATHKRLQTRLVHSCFSLPSLPLSRSLPSLRALEAARQSAPATSPPPTHYCLQLYSVLLNSDDPQISRFCSQALLNIRLQLHCSPPSLNFALEPQEDTLVEEKKKNRISERNRAALEALLGADKVPKPAGEQEEVISLIDEPSNKKPRIEDCDKISVSSDSADSSSDILEVDQDVTEVVEIVNNIRPDIQEEDDESTDTIILVPTENGCNGNTHNDQNDIDAEVEVTQPKDSNKSDVISEDKVDSTQPDKAIYSAATQMPTTTVQDYDEETPLSMEVSYDYPNTGSEKVTVLEKLELGANLPSSNDTDDIQITCGQVAKSSQDAEKVEENKNPKVKVSDVSSEKQLQNGDVTESYVTTLNVTVEDMLADFVDEVSDDTQKTESPA